MVTRITNPKVATLEPTWRRYRGISVLFDNPGTRTRPGICALAGMTVDDPAQQRLYDALADVVADADPDGMRGRYGFCPLPRHTYHVTICDGPNERDVASVSRPYRTAVAALIEELPGSLARVPSTLGLLYRSELLTAVEANPVTLGASDIVVWGHVLAARLEPVDPTAHTAVERVARARTDLTEEVQAELRLRTQAWRPHVSLGYFPNSRAAEGGAATLGRWNRAWAARSRPMIAFRSAAVYGFTDMVSYYRLGDLHP